MFKVQDDSVLEFLEEEGQSIEPKFYLPILPLVLVNGAEGIGTGWSTSIPQFNPKDIITNIRRLMRGEQLCPMLPWYKGFQGIIEKHTKGYTFSGVCRKLSDTQVEITELPIGKWTRDYKNFLEELAQKEEIDDIAEYHTENRVRFVVSS